MKAPLIPANEEERIRQLHELDILDTVAEDIYDHITQAASKVVGVPISLVSLVDSNRQWFKSRCGLDAGETSRDISFCGHVVYENTPLIIENALEDERFSDNPLVAGAPNIRSYVGMPLLVDKNISLGTLCVIDTEPRTFTQLELEILGHLTDTLVEVLKHRRESLIDPLTAAFNRRMFDRLAEKSLAKATRDNQPLSIIVMDIDHFKTVNDNFGHHCGDLTLKQLVRLFQEQLRTQDNLFRMGGEEFSILLADTEINDAVKLAERIRASIESSEINFGEHQFNVTVSIGVAEYTHENFTISGILDAADKALYLAKEMGRNRVISTGSNDTELRRSSFS